MKKLFIAFLPLLFIFLSSCSNDSGGTGSDPFGGGGGGTGGVTFQVGTTQGQQGINFTFNPSTNVTVTQITVSLPAQNFQDVVQGDGTTVFGPQNGFSVGEYTGVATGQQWTFKITGKIGSATGTAYDVTTNFTIP